MQLNRYDFGTAHEIVLARAGCLSFELFNKAVKRACKELKFGSPGRLDGLMVDCGAISPYGEGYLTLVVEFSPQYTKFCDPIEFVKVSLVGSVLPGHLGKKSQHPYLHWFSATVQVNLSMFKDVGSEEKVNKRVVLDYQICPTCVRLKVVR